VIRTVASFVYSGETKQEYDFMHQLSCENPCRKDEWSSFFQNTQVRLVAAKKSEFAAPWFYRARQGMASFYVVINGSCHLRFEETEEGFTLRSGDLAVLLSGKSHWLQHETRRDGVNGGEVCSRTAIVRGRFTWDENELALLLPELPKIVHFRNEDGRLVSWMAKTLRMITDGPGPNGPDARAIINHLAHTVFVQSVRAHLTLRPPTDGQVLAFRHYHQIEQALHLIHSQPGAPWSLNLLAKKCGMSRSGFAGEFKRTTGKAPMTYLMERRMDKACELLSRSSLKIKEVSALVGYGSQGAFSNAFRRWARRAPGSYRKGLKSF
jgi:AraC-like DNA-binding protein